MGTTFDTMLGDGQRYEPLGIIIAPIASALDYAHCGRRSTAT